MSHLAFDVSATGAGHAAGVPMPPGLAALSIPERMAEVIRARRLQGCPTTERDFLEAVETCDLSVAELHANIGTAKRLLHPELVRHDQPAAPVQPWDYDREYRAERVSRAVATLAAALEAERRPPARPLLRCRAHRALARYRRRPHRPPRLRPAPRRRQPRTAGGVSE